MDAGEGEIISIQSEESLEGFNKNLVTEMKEFVTEI